MTKTYLKYRTRITFLAGIILLAWAGLCIRLFQVQVLNGEQYQLAVIKQSQKKQRHLISKTWNASETMISILVWADPAPTCRHLGHQKSMPMPTHGRIFKFLLILIAFECSWRVQGWTHEPPFSSNFRLCPFRVTPGGHRVAKTPLRTPQLPQNGRRD